MTMDIHEKQVLTPEVAYQHKVSLATLTQASVPQAGQIGPPAQIPQATGGAPMAPVSTQALLCPGSTTTTAAQPATPTPLHPYQLSVIS